jgi:hypothetical protein
MIIHRRSLISGKTNTMDLPVTEEQIETWQNGGLIQDVFPELTPDEREFIKTGITSDEWQKL